MAPKAKTKTGGAKTGAKAKAKADAKAKASRDPPSPAAGSAVAAVRQSRSESLVNAKTSELAESNGSTDVPDSATSLAAATPASIGGDVAAQGNEKIKDEAKDIQNKVEAKEEEKLQPAAQQEEKQEEKQEKEERVDLASIADPWDSVPDDKALVKIREEDWEVIQLDTSEPKAPSHLAASDGDETVFRPTMAQRCWLVSVDLSGNQLPNVAAVGGPLWLRALSLGNNPLTSLDGLVDDFPRLLHLDLSFVDIPSIDGAWTVLAACEKLQRLTAEGSSIASFEDMEPMPKLRALELCENCIEDLDELSILAEKCSGLLELDLRENDVTTEGGYLKRIKKLFPKLQHHDNQSQKAYVAKRRDDAYKDIGDGMDKERTGIDGLYFNESCSCLEGNPCIDPETCKDWKNREKVAAEARKRKGLRDETGKQL